METGQLSVCVGGTVSRDSRKFLIFSTLRKICVFLVRASDVMRAANFREEQLIILYFCQLNTNVQKIL